MLKFGIRIRTKESTTSITEPLLACRDPKHVVEILYKLVFNETKVLLSVKNENKRRRL
jgi:hypothetical protein